MGKREDQIVDLVHHYEELSVQELSELLGTSTASVRRDLGSLADNRFVRRTHGGLKLATVINYEPLWIHRIPVDLQEAHNIACRAIELIQPGDVIGLSGGELCTQLALLVRLIEGVTVVTNAVNIASELACIPGIQVRLTGGTLNPGSFELVGQAVEPSLQGVHIQKFFLGTDGISLEYGVTNHDEAEAASARTIMKHSDATIVLADCPKFNQASFAQVAPISFFHKILTTCKVPPATIHEFENSGVLIDIVPAP
jgi:DeoR/GlpR family transcriptional regulator of sugar metabolism